jgi:CARDB
MLAFIVAAALTGASCANPSIVTANIQSVTPNGGLNHYTIAITVENLGNVAQPATLLQSLEVFQDREKVDQIGLQPLRPQQSQTVTYSFDRGADAGVGTTHLRFSLDEHGQSGNHVSCFAGNETFAINV